MLTKQFTFDNCKAIVHYPENQDRIKKATVEFLKEVERSKREGVRR